MHTTWMFFNKSAFCGLYTSFRFVSRHFKRIKFHMCLHWLNRWLSCLHNSHDFHSKFILKESSFHFHLQFYSNTWKLYFCLSTKPSAGCVWFFNKTNLSWIDCNLLEPINTVTPNWLLLALKLLLIFPNETILHIGLMAADC